MARYKYTAQTAEGKNVKGTMIAADERELHQRLREGGMYLLSSKEMINNRHGRQFKAKVLAEFSRELGTLVGAGVTLVRALNILAHEESVKPKERAVYEELQARLRQGVSLSDAMEAQGNVFPPLMIYMFRSAETGGNLDEVALKMADLYEKEYRLNSKISSAMTYPKILAVMIVGVILIMTNYVLPQLDDLFSQMEVLPLSTRILVAVGDVLQNYWYLVLLAAAALFVVWKWLMTIESVRVKWHKALIHMPLIGKLQQVVYTSRFARTMSSLYSAGIPIVSCLQIARKTIGNDYIDQQFDEVIPFVRAGNNLSAGLDRVDGFVRKLTDSIMVGEETGRLDSMLLSTADALEYDADMAITKMVSYVEPCMLLLMGLIVAFVMVAVFSALYGSYDAIAGMA